MATDLGTLRQWMQQRVAAPEFREFLAESLLQKCRIDTIPTRNIADTCHREGRLLSLIEETIARHGLAGRLERSSISRTIAVHPFYTFPHYAGTADVYSGRGNLLYLRDPPPAASTNHEMANGGIAVNAHIDTVGPYFAPRREGERVIEEEMGGNGSLALAMDEQLSERYGTVVVLECCDGQVHPGGRGALWYRVEIPAFAEDPSARPAESVTSPAGGRARFRADPLDGSDQIPVERGGATGLPPLLQVHLEADALLQGYDSPGELFQAPQ